MAKSKQIEGQLDFFALLEGENLDKKLSLREVNPFIECESAEKGL